jgi:hypothetical protein
VMRTPTAYRGSIGNRPSGPGRANGAASAGHRGGEINHERPHPSAPPRGGAHDRRRRLHRSGFDAVDAGARCNAAVFDPQHDLRHPMAQRPAPGSSPDPLQRTALARFRWTGQGGSRCSVRVPVPAEGAQPGRLFGDLPAGHEVLAPSSQDLRVPPMVRLQRSSQRDGVDPYGAPVWLDRVVLRLRTRTS